MNRREFIAWAGLSSLASSLPVALAACTPQQSSSSPAEFQTVGTVTELDKTGQLLNEQISDNKVLVIRNADQIAAVNPTCTHAGCTVAWQAEQKALICPCHNSIFAIDGKVLKGPADKPLTTYPVQTEGNNILVKV